MVQRYDRIENMDPNLEPSYNTAMVLKSAEGVRVRLHQAKADVPAV